MAKPIPPDVAMKWIRFEPGFRIEVDSSDPKNTRSASHWLLNHHIKMKALNTFKGGFLCNNRRNYAVLIICQSKSNSYVTTLFIFLFRSRCGIFSNSVPLENETKYAGIGKHRLFTAVMASIAASYALFTVFDNLFTAIFFD